MSIRLLQSIFIAGVLSPVDGSTLSLSPALEADLVNQGKAVWVSSPSLPADNGVEVKFKGDPLTGGIDVLIGSMGKKLRAIYDPTIPVLLIGGDHPYKQWYGTTGKNGMAQMYADRGIIPYLALNTGNGNTYLQLPAEYMSWSEMSAISDRVELVAHGHRHVNDWRLVNTGITVRYAGAAATATVVVTATNITGVTAGAVANFDFVLASYTLSQLAAAIAAASTGGHVWTCTIAEELSGAEASAKLLTRAATDAKTADLNLCAGGGILITNTGTTYKRLTVYSAAASIEIYADGVNVYTQAYAGQTLQQIVTAINALGGGITATLTNDTPATSVNYCSGSEDAQNLADNYWLGKRHVTTQGLMLSSGLTHWYIVDQQFKKCKSVAAANGVTLRHFAQSGGGFYSDEAAGHSSYVMHRGNPKGNSMVPAPFMRVSNFQPHYGISQAVFPTPSGARWAALLAALIDSPGYCINVLVHYLIPDGTSGYSLPTTVPASGDQVEGEFVAFLDSVKAAVAAGSINVMTMEQFKSSVPVNLGTLGNLLFNPRLKNSGESLLLASSVAGNITPGWRNGALSAIASSAFIDAEGFLTVVFTSATSVSMLQQYVSLPPGLYEFSAEITEFTYTSGEGVVLSVQSYSPDYFTRGSVDMVPGQTLFNNIGAYRGTGKISMRFPVAPPRPAPAEVISKTAETYNLSTNKNLRVNINSIGTTTDIDVSVTATAAGRAATAKAKDVAIDINNFMAASTYGAEYHNIAKAVNGRVVVTNPYVGSDRTHNVSVVDGTTLSAAFAIFGGSVEGSPLLANHDAFGGIPITLSVSAAFVGTVKIGALCLRRIGDSA